MRSSVVLAASVVIAAIAAGWMLPERPGAQPSTRRAGPGSLYAAILFIAIIAGIGLRLWQYLAHASLWLDEAALARNIIDRSSLGLITPLDYGQTAPPAFLLVEKAAVAVLGNNEF